MTGGFERLGDRITKRLAPGEVAVLASLAGTLEETLASSLREHDDPVLDRLLPAAYGPEEKEAAAEFAEHTRDRLVAAKRLRLHSVLDALGEGAVLDLDLSGAEQWLLALNDIRLALAERIGTDHLHDESDGENRIGEIYEWLGWLQSGLVDVIAEDDSAA